MNGEIIVRASKIKRKKKIAKIAKMALLIFVLLLLVLYVVISIVYNNGSFSITLDRELYLKNTKKTMESFFKMDGFIVFL